jgi:N-methylhydantoinase A
MSSEEIMRIATDVGGTFTDLVYLQTHADGSQNIGTAKSDTTPPNFEQGVMDVYHQAQLDASKIDFFAHGTTVIINALTERKGAKTGLITTEGFRDTLEIARGNRPDFFNLDYIKPEPFVPRYLRKELPGRIDYHGEEIKPLNLEALPEILEDFKKEQVTAIAICFINSYANITHENRVADRIKELWPEVAVVASNQITREWREYERTNTAVLSAYVKPVALKYLNQLTNRLKEAGLESTPFIMQSNCGVDTVNSTREIPITMVESGPASGVWGAAALGRIIDEQNVIALDIGGTTAKCALIKDGDIQINTNYMIGKTAKSAGYPIMVPVVDLVEIGNGGGSIAWVDEYQKLHVGPQSAGALPGPASYGKGGQEATTTDANLSLGRINADYFCGGAINADMKAVNSSLDKLADELKIDRQEAARGIVRIANNNMVNAVKLVSVNRGYDPRDFTMIAFGGGGGMHACELASELGIKKVVIPKQSAVFSAWGMLMCDIRRDFIQTQIIELNAESAMDDLNQVLNSLENKAITEFAAEDIAKSRIQFTRFGRFRYQNQEHSVEVQLPEGTINPEKIDEIRENFHVNYKREYTYRLDSPVDLVSFHLVASVEVGKLKPEQLKATGRDIKDVIKETREVDFTQDGFHQTTIYNGDLLEPGMEFTGPAIIEEAGTTVVIPPQMPIKIDEFGNVHIYTTIIEKGV